MGSGEELCKCLVKSGRAAAGARRNERDGGSQPASVGAVVEWQFLLAQSKAEREEIELQIETQKIATNAARISLAQAQKAQAQAQEYFTFLKNRATGAALYQWLLSQMSTLYFQAYDVVLSLCLSTEACWQYEIGDRDTRFIPSTAWADNYYGLTAGETLKLGLLRMESAFLNRHERRLELTKTISLRELLGQHSDEHPQGRSWAEIITALKGDAQGELTFALKASTFDKDYPIHHAPVVDRIVAALLHHQLGYQGICHLIAHTHRYRNSHAAFAALTCSVVAEPAPVTPATDT